MAKSNINYSKSGMYIIRLWFFPTPGQQGFPKRFFFQMCTHKRWNKLFRSRTQRMYFNKPIERIKRGNKTSEFRQVWQKRWQENKSKGDYWGEGSQSVQYTNQPWARHNNYALSLCSLLFLALNEKKNTNQCVNKNGHLLKPLLELKLSISYSGKNSCKVS